MKKLVRSEKGRFLIGLVLVAMAALVLTFFSAFAIWRVDLTGNRVMTPDPAALEIIESVSEPVTLTFVVDDESDDIWVSELTRRYAEASRFMTWKTVSSSSATLNNLTAQTGSSIESGSVIVESDKRWAIVTLDDLYSYEYDQMSYYTTGSLRYTRADFTAQNALANAILYVTRDDMPVVYALTGHGEAQAGTMLTTLCRQNAVDLRTFDLSEAQAIPDDAAAVVIYAPSAGYDETAAALIEDYLARGGCVLLMSDYESDLGALEDVAAQFGMALKGGLVLDGDDDHVYSSDYRYYLLPDVAETGCTQEGTLVLMPVACALEKNDVQRSSLSVEELLSTSELAYRKINTDQVATLEQEESDETGRFVLGLAAQEGDSLFVWLGSTSMLSEDADTVTGGGNSAFILGVLDAMMTRPEGVSIEADSMLTSSLKAPSIPALALVMILPLALLIAGFIAVRRARRV